jgi:hypothetical protein
LKRAQSTGKSINIEAIRLCPGRQTRERKPPRPSPKTYKSRRKIALFNSNRKEKSEGPEEIVVDRDADHVVFAPAPVEEVDQEDEPQYEPQSKGDRKVKEA